MAEVSKVRQNYHKEVEAGVNKQINLGKIFVFVFEDSQRTNQLLILELYASYVYQQLVSSLCCNSNIFFIYSPPI